MSSLGTMTARLALDYSDLMKGLRASSSGFSGVGRNAGSAQSHTRRLNQELSRTSGLLAQLGRGPGIAAIAIGSAAGGMLARVTGALAAVPGKALRLASNAEQTAISFEVLLGSADRAKAMLAELQAYADKSPFDLKGAADAAKNLAQMGIQAQDIMPAMKVLGDVSGGDTERFNRLAYAFGQVTSSGHLTGNELRQFTELGFNPLNLIAKATGEEMDALRKRMSEGAVSAAEVNAAFVKATSSGGQFENMIARQAETVAGKFSTMKDKATSVLRDLGKSLITSLDVKGWLDYMTAALGKIPYLFQNAGTLLKAELLNWRIYFAELVPEFSATMGDIGILMGSGWEAMAKNSNKFFASVKAGLQEIRNLTEVAGAANKATANDPRHPSQWMRTAMNWLDDNASVNNSTGSTADFLFGKLQQQVPVDLKTGKPLSLVQSAMRAANPVLANQQDAIKPGTDWASSFLKDYKKGIADAVAKPDGGIASIEALKKQQAELRNSLIPAANLTAPFDFGGKPGDSFAKAAAGKAGISGAADSASNSAANRHTEAAAKIMTSGIGRTKEVELLTKIEKHLANNNNPFKPKTDEPPPAGPLEWGIANF